MQVWPAFRPSLNRPSRGYGQISACQDDSRALSSQLQRDRGEVTGGPD